jgi:hypothetical protein
MTPAPASDPIICKPTSWFLLRAVAMLVMFGVFAILFYRDGSTGYREKNEAFYLNRTFQLAQAEFSRMNEDGGLTAEAWREHAEQQTVAFPDDPYVLPAGTDLAMPWPEILRDHERMKPLQWNLLWKEYSGQNGYDEKPVEEAYTRRKIDEQWWVFWICLGLAAAAAFILLRTLRRSIVADDEGVITQTGRKVPYEDLKTLDLRKWDTKGLAFVDYGGASGSGRIRLDGLTYGGFKKEQDQPAERLIQRIRSRFSGEIVEYAVVAEPAAGEVAPEEG